MNARCHACIGGTRIAEDILKLKEKNHIVVGTPGRVNDMINRQILGKLLQIIIITRALVLT